MLQQQQQQQMMQQQQQNYPFHPMYNMFVNQNRFSFTPSENQSSNNGGSLKDINNNSNNNNNNIKSYSSYQNIPLYEQSSKLQPQKINVTQIKNQ